MDMNKVVLNGRMLDAAKVQQVYMTCALVANTVHAEKCWKGSLLTRTIYFFQ